MGSRGDAVCLTEGYGHVGRSLCRGGGGACGTQSFKGGREGAGGTQPVQGRGGWGGRDAVVSREGEGGLRCNVDALTPRVCLNIPSHKMPACALCFQVALFMCYSFALGMLSLVRVLDVLHVCVVCAGSCGWTGCIGGARGCVVTPVRNSIGGALCGYDMCLFCFVIASTMVRGVW